MRHVHPDVEDHLDLVDWAARLTTTPLVEHEDVRQELVIELDSALRAYDGTAPLRPWLRLRLKHRRNDVVRRIGPLPREYRELGVEPPLYMEDIETPVGATRDRVFDPVEADRVRRAVCALPPRERRVVVERVWGNRSIVSIAKELNVTEGRCRDLWDQARTRLRRSLTRTAFS